MSTPEPTDTIGVIGRTLLIVDDHAKFRSFARALLEADGFEVVGEAEDARSGIAAAASLRPDVVLLDVMLPDGDGFGVCAAITSGPESPLVVLTSSRDVSNYRDSLDRSAARGFIAKSDLSGDALSALIE